MKIPCTQTRLMSQFFQAGQQNLSLRSLLVGTGRPYRLLVFTTLDDSATQSIVPRGRSCFDWNWGGPRYGTANFGTNNKKIQSNRDIQSMYATVNGVARPAQRLELAHADSLASGASNQPVGVSSSDIAEPFEMYKHICADPQDTFLAENDWRSMKMYCIDLLRSDDASVADPIESNVSIEVRLKLNRQSEANRIIYVVGQYQSQLTIDAARAVTNDMQ